MRPRVSNSAHEIVLLLLDEGRHRAALHQELHVADRRGQASANDLERDGIDAARGPPADGDSQACERSRRRLCALSTRARKPGRDEARGVGLVDDGRAGEGHARSESLPRIDGNGSDAAATEVDGALIDDGAARIRARRRGRRGRRTLRQLADGGDAEVDQLDLGAAADRSCRAGDARSGTWRSAPRDARGVSGPSPSGQVSSKLWCS